MFKSLFDSIVFDTDSYKVSMWNQYEPGTEYVYSYLSARGGMFDEVTFIGLQDFTLNVLNRAVTKDEVELADQYWTAHGEPFNRAGWDYIVEEHGGKLPLEVRSVDEGSVIPTGNVLVTVVNTDPLVPWLTTWVETALLRACHYPSSIATLSRNIKRVILDYLELSGDPAGIDFKLHDFGSRATNAPAIGAMAHLANFKGTDTFVGVLKAIDSYEGKLENLAFSIPAMEHSTVTSWGPLREGEAFDNMITKYGSGMYAMVIDSYDTLLAIDKIGFMRDKIKSMGGTLVVRPDSGNPCELLPLILTRLSEYFGYTRNSKGYKVLNPCVRVLWGDGINLESIKNILSTLVYDYNWSADNIAFGMGSALLNGMKRDDLGWAVKASAIKVKGQYWRGFNKAPVTDSTKTSKAGRVVVCYNASMGYYTGFLGNTNDILSTRYYNGSTHNLTTFDEIRERCKLT